MVSVPGRTVIELATARVGYADPPCLGDIQKFCSDTPSGGGQIQGRLKSHEAEFSKGRKAHVGELLRTGRQLAATCVWDIERFCSDVAPGGGRVATCLQTNKDQLSPTCADQFSKSGKN